jgi:hypothetical protein
MYSLFLSIFFGLHVSGAICTYPQEQKLQRTVIGMCNGYGMLMHRSSTCSNALTYHEHQISATNRKVAESIPDGVIGTFH